MWRKVSSAYQTNTSLPISSGLILTNSTQQQTYEVYFSEQKIHSVSFGVQNTHRILLSRPPHDGHIIVITISKNRKFSTSSSSSSSTESYAHWFTFTDVEYNTEKQLMPSFFLLPLLCCLGRLRHYCTPSCSYTFHVFFLAADDQSLVQSQLRQAVKIMRSVQEAKQRDGTGKNYTREIITA